jgi:hypothetical protein
MTIIDPPPPVNPPMRRRYSRHANRAIAEAYAALCEVEMRLRKVADVIELAKRSIETLPQPPQPGP